MLSRVGKPVDATALDRAHQLDKIVWRTEWERNVRAQKAQQARQKKDGVEDGAMTVDWDDFVVVQGWMRVWVCGCVCVSGGSEY